MYGEPPRNFKRERFVGITVGLVVSVALIWSFNEIINYTLDREAAKEMTNVQRARKAIIKEANMQKQIASNITSNPVTIRIAKEKFEALQASIRAIKGYEEIR